MALRPRLNQTVSERRNGSVGIICSPFNDWRKKKISGRRCAKCVIDAGALGICSAIGGVIGGAIGSAAGPVGGVAGAATGFVAGGAGEWVGEKICPIEKFTCWLFKLPRTAALDMAYNFFGLKHKASESEIKATYRRLALEYHPDKGGNQENFSKLAAFYDIIKKDRGFN